MDGGLGGAYFALCTTKPEILSAPRRILVLIVVVAALRCMRFYCAVLLAYMANFALYAPPDDHPVAQSLNISIFIFVSFFPAPQVAMQLAARIAVGPHDVAARVNPVGTGEDSAGEINRSELAPAQQPAMRPTVRIPIESHDIAAGVDPVGNGESSVGEINRSEGIPAQQKVWVLPSALSYRPTISRRGLIPLAR